MGLWTDRSRGEANRGIIQRKDMKAEREKQDRVRSR